MYLKSNLIERYYWAYLLNYPWFHMGTSSAAVNVINTALSHSHLESSFFILLPFFSLNSRGGEFHWRNNHVQSGDTS